jgi:hypothetical protein
VEISIDHSAAQQSAHNSAQCQILAVHLCAAVGGRLHSGVFVDTEAVLARVGTQTPLPSNVTGLFGESRNVLPLVLDNGVAARVCLAACCAANTSVSRGKFRRIARIFASQRFS